MAAGYSCCNFVFHEVSHSWVIDIEPRLLRDGEICNRVDAFARRHQLRQPLLTDEGVLRGHERRDVVDFDDPFVREARERVATQSELYGAALLRAATRRVIRVPLQSDIGSGDRPSPRGSIRERGGSERRGDGSSEDLIEAASPHLDGENAFLALLRCPPAAVHHPEEVRLDPRHPRSAPPWTEALVLRSVSADRGAICLVNHDAVIVVLREDVASSSWPQTTLLKIGFEAEHGTPVDSTIQCGIG